MDPTPSQFIAAGDTPGERAARMAGVVGVKCTAAAIAKGIMACCGPIGALTLLGMFAIAVVEDSKK